MQEREYVLEMKNICKHFGQLMANDHINLSVRKGTVHAIIGENGAGKSTLMNILTCVHKMDAGEIYLNGNMVNFAMPKDAVEAGIGMVHQELMLYEGMTVLENIILGYEPEHMGFIKKKKALAEITEICEKYHFQVPLNQKVDELPIGVLQQVEIIKVLYREADIIILDEPTSVLTPQGIRGLFDAIHFLTERGKTIIFISHKLKEVLEIADDITVLKDGKVSGNMPNKNVTEQMLASMMVGREVLLHVNKPERYTGKTILEVKNLSVKDSNNIRRVEHVDFCVHEGEIVGIAGVAGSGQKELIEAIVGLTVPEKASRVLLDGQDVSALSLRERRMIGMGYIPQDRIRDGVNKQGKIWENCIMGYHLNNGTRRHFLMDFDQFFKFSDNVVEEYRVKIQDMDDQVGTLSGGNIQKLIVGREFLQDKKLLIIEDPTRGIDVGAIEFIWKKIIEISQKGIAILLVSHELNEIRQLSDRILVAYNGEILAPEHSTELSEEELGLYMTGGRIDA